MHCTPEGWLMKPKQKQSVSSDSEGWITLIVVGMAITIAVPVPEINVLGFFSGCALLIGVVVTDE